MIDQRRNQQFFIREDNLKKRCSAAGLEYKLAVVNEKRHITRCRRETMLLLLKDPEAIQRRNKKQTRDRNRKLTEEQRTNKNKKMRTKYNSLSREEKTSLNEKQKHRRLQSRWDALLNMISKYNSNQSSKEVDTDTNNSIMHAHTYDSTQKKLRAEDINDTNCNDNDDLVYCNDNATISGDTIIFDDHYNCNSDEFGNEESTNDINSNNNNINHNKNTIVTSYIYIHQMKPGPHNITKAEKTRSGQRGDMYRTLQQIGIMPGTTFMYSTEGGSSLRACPHGAALESDKELSDKILNNHKVELIDISKETAKGEVYKVDGVRVVYDDSKIIQDMENQQFKQQIIAHFLENHQKTEVEQKNKNRDGHSTAKFTRLDGGVQDRYPRNSLGITKSYNGEKIPIIKTKNFEKLSPEVLAYLFKVIFPSGQKFLDDSGGSERYNDKLRYNLFAYKFNNALGFGSAKTRFEYYDILVTEVSTLSGASLYRHVDGKNDNRAGYTGSVVYSFHSLRCISRRVYYCSGWIVGISSAKPQLYMDCWYFTTTYYE